jgi:hypothetical protein
MDKPKLTDYATLIFTLFEQFEQAERGGTAKVGKPYTFSQKCFIVLFVILQFRHIFEFKAQKRWLEEHPDMFSLLKWPRVPHRTTFSRSYKALGSLLAAFITFVGGALVAI